MNCCKCRKNIPNDSLFCSYCGTNQTQSVKKDKRKKKTRGNGMGTVYKLPNGTYKVEVVLGYSPDHKKIRKTKSGYLTKKAAIDDIPNIRKKNMVLKPDITFTQLFEKWQDFYSPRITKSTMNCYKAAFAHFHDLHYSHFAEIVADELQACIDKCQKGKQTKRNMKALLSLVYTYANMHGLVDKNFSQAMFVSGEEGARRGAFSPEEIEIIKKHVGKVPFADYIMVLIYTGFRPTEMLTLTQQSYDPVDRALTGGIKTTAGKNRIITIAPQIQSIIDAQAATGNKYLFPNAAGQLMTERYFRDAYYYPALEAMGLPKVVPYTCRHTFATLMKKVDAPAIDKQKLMGHTKYEQTVYYTDTDFASLRAITDNLSSKPSDTPSSSPSGTPSTNPSGTP